ncbi:hypothetical protein NE857_09515 [Nocardiopsis exhalans]|uniref:DUF559 domain-containing protein n=1 Tax=Nocardiopsis exhalans TaxID=163604 RepID=A0ABY5DF41_9ACTN|nr:hypothetical protein [Nocardiopsis exhalans]USY21818.1 hypothetical protein NE857_09515 [Nocardiopsis exhalans]
MPRDHTSPTGCSPLFPLPRPALRPKAHRAEPPSGPGSPLAGLPPDHDLLLRTLRPVLAHLSADAVAFGRTAAYVWGVDPHPRGTAVTRDRPHVALPPCRVDTGQGPFRADPGWPAYRVVVEYDSAEFHSSRHERARDELRHTAVREAGWLVVSIGVHDLCAHPAGFPRQVLAALTDRG